MLQPIAAIPTNQTQPNSKVNPPTDKPTKEQRLNHSTTKINTHISQTKLPSTTEPLTAKPSRNIKSTENKEMIIA